MSEKRNEKFENVNFNNSNLEIYQKIEMQRKIFKSLLIRQNIPCKKIVRQQLQHSEITVTTDNYDKNYLIKLSYKFTRIM